MSFDPLRPDRVADFYTKQHLTQREIAKLEGISAPAVCKILKRLAIPASAGEWVVTVCVNCHQSFRRERGRFRKTRRPCCSRACYFELRKNPHYRPWRQGQRRAREVVKALGVHLLPGFCVHHHDFNNRNNKPSNLAVFATKSDHSKYHHTGQPQPLWDGRNIVKRKRAKLAPRCPSEPWKPPVSTR